MRIKVNRLLLLGLVFTIASITSAYSQKIAVKTNLLYDATTTMNLGVELGLNKKWTLDVSGNYNPWTFSNNKKWKHWMAQPEAKYWLCEKFNGHYFGVHLHGGEFNVGGLNTDFKILSYNFADLKHYRYEGWFVGGGISYGYSWILSNRWNFEAGIGVGYAGFKYDKYECPECGSWLDDGFFNYFGVTKLALSIIYIIK